MSTTTTTFSIGLYNTLPLIPPPSNSSSSVVSKSIKPTSILAKRLYFLDTRKPVSWVNFTPSHRKLMSALKATNVIDSDEDGNGIPQALEHEVLIDAHSDSLLGPIGGGGLESTLNTLSKYIVVVLFGGIILLRHDAVSLWAAMGAILNVILSITLKKILNQERPVSASRSGPGMPSSHGQSIFYTVTFIIVSLLERYRINGLTATLSVLFFTTGSYFSWLRVSQQLHTISQVVVGSIIGSMFSLFWIWSWNNFVLNLFISYLWVRIIVVLGAISFCMGFLYYVYKSWLLKER